jgi:hypothetical protein
MSSRPELRVDWCSHQAAKHAVEKWHYSQRLPMPPLVKVGAWEGGKFIGCVLFGRGANNAIGREYRLTQLEACELVRIALTSHETPVSRIASLAIRFLQKQSPGVRLVISYADAEQGHHGGVYQAMNWLYVGRSMGSTEFFHEGRWKHNREVTSGAFGGARAVADISSLPKRKTQGKHKYLMPLDDAMRAQIAPLAKPYPKRAKQAMAEHPSAQRQGSTDPHAPNHEAA